MEARRILLLQIASILTSSCFVHIGLVYISILRYQLRRHCLLNGHHNYTLLLARWCQQAGSFEECSAARRRENCPRPRRLFPACVGINNTEKHRETPENMYVESRSTTTKDLGISTVLFLSSPTSRDTPTPAPCINPFLSGELFLR